MQPRSVQCRMRPGAILPQLYHPPGSRVSGRDTGYPPQVRRVSAGSDTLDRGSLRPRLSLDREFRFTGAGGLQRNALQSGVSGLAAGIEQPGRHVLRTPPSSPPERRTCRCNWRPKEPAAALRCRMAGLPSFPPRPRDRASRFRGSVYCQPTRMFRRKPWSPDHE